MESVERHCSTSHTCHQDEISVNLGGHRLPHTQTVRCLSIGTIPSFCCTSMNTVVEMNKPTVAIVYYSMYGHVRMLALDVKKGLEEAGCKVTLLRVAETLSEEVLAKMGAPGVGKVRFVMLCVRACSRFDGARCTRARRKTLSRPRTF